MKPAAKVLHIIKLNIPLSKPIRLVLIAAFVLLPFTHLRLLPDLGTTRPISSVLFVLAFGMICLEYVLNGLGSLRSTIFNLQGWKILRYWLVLIGLGIISVLITPLYGNFFQAINRLLGYLIIFTTLYCALYALNRYGIKPIALWISLGYLPALLYGCIETLASFNLSWALTIVQTVRQYVIVDKTWSGHVALFATEPSFVSFQVILLIAILPFLEQRWLRWTNLAVIFLSFFFTLSGHVVLQVIIYLIVLGFLSFKRITRLRVAAGVAAFGVLSALGYFLITPIQAAAQVIFSRLMEIKRLQDMTLSASIRGSYLANLVFTMIDTHGLGLGIGQYGQFWKEIYLRHINFEPLGNEVIIALNSTEYMRPWSVILGIGVDLGVVGLALILGFLYEVWHSIRNIGSHSAHGQAIWVSSVIALIGAYPIVTPHVWIALALLAGLGARQLDQPGNSVEAADPVKS